MTSIILASYGIDRFEDKFKLKGQYFNKLPQQYQENITEITEVALLNSLKEVMELSIELPFPHILQDYNHKFIKFIDMRKFIDRNKIFSQFTGFHNGIMNELTEDKMFDETLLYINKTLNELLNDIELKDNKIIFLIGCKSGKHRSVGMVNLLEQCLLNDNYNISSYHIMLSKYQQTHEKFLKNNEIQSKLIFDKIINKWNYFPKFEKEIIINDIVDTKKPTRWNKKKEESNSKNKYIDREIIGLPFNSRWNKPLYKN